MSLDASWLDTLVATELSRMEPGRRASLAARLVTPAVRELAWDYGERDESYPCWALTGADGGSFLVYSMHGFGPRAPWGCVDAASGRMGMDAQWHDTLESAAIVAGWLPPRPALDRVLDRLASRFDVEMPRELATVGETVLAFETLVSRIVDAEPMGVITLDELAELEDVGAELGCEASWLDLLPCLVERERPAMSRRMRERARVLLAAKVAPTPERAAWLVRARASLDG